MLGIQVLQQMMMRTLDDVTSPDIGVGGEHIDTDERAAPMVELTEKLVEKKVGGGIEICTRPPSLTDARDASPPADDDAASKQAATLDDVTSPDIGVGGEHIDTDERAAPMRELPEKLVENKKRSKN
jgi:hypothetical protein